MVDGNPPCSECGGKGYVIEDGPEHPRTPMDAPLAHTCETCGETEPTAEDIAYERAQHSLEWEQRHGGGL